MADNYLENHALDYEKRKAKRERELQQRRNRYLRAYQEKLRQQKEKSTDDKLEAGNNK